MNIDAMLSKTITRELVAALKEARSLSWQGIHGVEHWLRVRENGLRLAAMNGADSEIIELFAFIHDIKRLNDGYDPEHGQRAADFARTLWGSLIHLEANRFERLVYACAHHTGGMTEGDLTVRTCWDADRLDLGRVDIIPDPKRLCTAAACDPEVLAWAIKRSRDNAL
jgi:uncharacterized protein